MFSESSLRDLYHNIVQGFPRTGLRQHATDTIKIANLSYIPFQGLKTLLVKGLAQNNGKEYNPLILFKGVKYFPEYKDNLIKLKTMNETVFLDPLTTEQEVLVRCSCSDFNWRFTHYNHLDKSLYGRNRSKYEATTDRGPVNPEEVPGCCKHILKLWKALEHGDILR